MTSPEDQYDHDKTNRNPLDDPQWTAFAFGECDPEETARLTEELKDNADLAREIEEIRAVGGILEQEFSRAATSEGDAHQAQLDPTQRQRILAAATARPGEIAASRPAVPTWLRAAAVLLVALPIGWVASEVLGGREAVGRLFVASTIGEDAASHAQHNTIDSTTSDLASSDSTYDQPTVVDSLPPGDKATTDKPADIDGMTLLTESETRPNASVDAGEISLLEKTETEFEQTLRDPAPFEAPEPNQPELRIADSKDQKGRTKATPSRPAVRRVRTAIPQTIPTITATDDFFMGTGRSGGQSQADAPGMSGSKAVRSAREPVALPESSGSGAFFDEFADGDVRGSSENLFRRNKKQRSSREYVGGLPKTHFHRHRLVANEEYSRITERPFDKVLDTPLSTFSIDVDTASYANTRRMLQAGQLPPADAIRIEEWLNYFRYDYPAPERDEPFSIDIEIADCPWQEGHRLAHIGLRGREFETVEPQARNLVFLVDVSGSMKSNNKLPLLKQGLRMLVENLTNRDRVAIVTYAGASGCALAPTSAAESAKILAAIDRLEAGGSTNGAAGIELAYQLAVQNYDREGVNRVVLATDGDFNVGVSADGPLTRLIEQKRESGVFLSVLGFGTGNLKDSKMEALADHGNGNYAYIDSIREARKVLVNDLGATLVTIAKDVKIQVEFNPAKVAAYRLIGYENRALAARDFNDDRKDAGEIGAGHRVTALYQIVPFGQRVDGANIDPLKYQSKVADTAPDAMPPAANSSTESLTVKLRYKQPDGSISKLIERGVVDTGKAFEAASIDFRFATAVAQFGLVLRRSQFAGTSSLEFVRSVARNAFGQDAFGYRQEFADLVERARQMMPDAR